MPLFKMPPLRVIRRVDFVEMEMGHQRRLFAEWYVRLQRAAVARVHHTVTRDGIDRWRAIETERGN